MHYWQLNMYRQQKMRRGILEARFNDLTASNESVIKNILAIDRYIIATENGADALAVQRPTIPRKVSPRSALILAVSIVLGGVIGVFFVLVRNAVRKRKEQLAEA